MQKSGYIQIPKNQVGAIAVTAMGFTPQAIWTRTTEPVGQGTKISRGMFTNQSAPNQAFCLTETIDDGDRSLHARTDQLANLTNLGLTPTSIDEDGFTLTVSNLTGSDVWVEWFAHD